MNILSKYHHRFSKSIAAFSLITLSVYISGCSTTPTHSSHTLIEETSSSQKNISVGPELVEDELIVQTKPEISEFLQHLSSNDAQNIRDAATRSTLPLWEHIDGRSQKVRQRVLKVLNEMNAPEELMFIPVAESGYNPYALSPAGAFGLWQLMPRTAIELGAHSRNGIDARRSVESSTKAAVKYLLKLHERFDSWPLAICAYNLGPWGVERRLRKKPWTYDMGLDKLPFPAETRYYVKQILGMIALQKDGKLIFSEPLRTLDMQVNAPVDLNQLESIAGLEKNELFHLNPGLDYQHYTNRDLNLHLPEENIEQLQLALKESPDIFKPKFITVTIKKGDSLWKIARRHHTSIRYLKRLNPKLGHTLSIGKNIVVPASSNISTLSSKTNPLLTKGRRIRYKVKSGDSLWTIAKKFGTSTRSIARTNQIAKNQLIRPGDRLWIVARFKPR